MTRFSLQLKYYSTASCSNGLPVASCYLQKKRQVIDETYSSSIYQVASQMLLLSVIAYDQLVQPIDQTLPTLALVVVAAPVVVGFVLPTNLIVVALSQSLCVPPVYFELL